MNIDSRSSGSAGALSNIHDHPFTFDGVLVQSMESFLQSLKHQDIAVQEKICALSGINAWKQRADNNANDWKKSQTLWWQGKSYARQSREYQELLDRAYDALAAVSSFQDALIASYPKCLTHYVGDHDTHDTVLTEAELCWRVLNLRHSVAVQRGMYS